MSNDDNKEPVYCADYGKSSQFYRVNVKS